MGVTNAVIDILSAFALKQANAHQVMRTLMLHDDWLVPSVFAARGLGREEQPLVMLGQVIAHPAGTLLIYSDIDTAVRAHEEQRLALGPFCRGVFGFEIFAALPAGLHSVIINEGAPQEKKLYLNAPSFGNAPVWADVLSFELELADDEAPKANRLSRVRAYDAYFTAMHAHNSAIVTLVNYMGFANAGVLFTAPDCLAAFLEAISASEGIQTGQTTGERVMSLLPVLGIDGIVINPMGPGITAAFSVAELTRA